jgi:hypothetical protein
MLVCMLEIHYAKCVCVPVAKDIHYNTCPRVTSKKHLTNQHCDRLHSSRTRLLTVCVFVVCTVYKAHKMIALLVVFVFPLGCFIYETSQRISIKIWFSRCALKAKWKIVLSLRLSTTPWKHVSGGKAPCILNLGTGRSWLVSLTLWSLYCRVRASSTH